MTKPTKWHVRPVKDQPGNPPSRIRIFAVRMKKAWVLNYPLSAQRRLIRLGVRPVWSVFAGRTCHSVGFVMRWLNYFSIYEHCQEFKACYISNALENRIIEYSQESCYQKPVIARPKLWKFQQERSPPTQVLRHVLVKGSNPRNQISLFNA